MIKVELGLDLGNSSPVGLTLDDAVKGKLDSPYVLGGSLFYDVTDSVKQVSTRRGKNQSLGNYDAGAASIVLDNSTRQYDPQNPESAIGQGLVPGREVRITDDSDPIYYGYIDDIDLSYEVSGQSETEIRCVDGFSKLAAANLASSVSTVLEKSGTRLGKLLDLADVAWPATLRDIDTGTKDVLATTIPANTNALQYAESLAESEFGALYIGKDGTLVFTEANASPLNPDFAFTDDLSISFATKVKFSQVGVTYGSEFLYNKIVLSNGTTTVTEQDTISQALYGVRTLEILDLLTSSSTDLTNVAKALLALYKNPRYRFETIRVNIKRLSPTDRAAVLDLELGDLISVYFTPNGIPPTIEQACRIVGISSGFSVVNEEMIFSVEPYSAGPSIFVLDSSANGVLDDDLLG